MEPGKHDNDRFLAPMPGTQKDSLLASLLSSPIIIDCSYVMAHLTWVCAGKWLFNQFWMTIFEISEIDYFHESAKLHYFILPQHRSHVESTLSSGNQTLESYQVSGLLVLTLVSIQIFNIVISSQCLQWSPNLRQIVTRVLLGKI